MIKQSCNTITDMDLTSLPSLNTLSRTTYGSRKVQLFKWRGDNASNSEIDHINKDAYLLAPHTVYGLLPGSHSPMGQTKYL